MKRVMSVTAARGESVEFSSLVALIAGVQESRTQADEPVIKARLGWGGRVKQITIEYDVFPSDAARERGHL